SIWADGYGISVPNELQVLNADVGALLAGFARRPGDEAGYDIYTAFGWDYPELVRTYRRAVQNAREHHTPAIVHVKELTQPQGHSTSGSHERYKSKERLEWEENYDGIRQMRLWILENGIASEEELDSIEEASRQFVERTREQAWSDFQAPIRAEATEFMDILDELQVGPGVRSALDKIKRNLARKPSLLRLDVMTAAHEALTALREDPSPASELLIRWKQERWAENEKRYSSNLYSETRHAALKVAHVPPEYSDQSPTVAGYQVMNACFDAILARDPRVIAFGEDLGKIGDVNQGFAGLQEKYGELRVSDTGIRETTIIGQAIGLAMRGLRPIAEIQYLDYLLYALQISSDDLATVRWRSAGTQHAPVIVRTRGHRLEGVWHSGSLMAGVMNLLHGMHILVPRNMVQAAGFYNTLLQSDEPGLIVEVLNGYRLKERLPDNIAELTTPVGVPEILRPGADLTVVTYGANCRIALSAAGQLAELGIETEIIDIQSLLPFDVHGKIGESLQKTSRVLFLDEDVPGGTSAYMMQQVLEEQNGFSLLDSEPRTLTG
ncbi:MAG: transketolase C-terminal domain-containing protein, partial [Candidatus Binatia bacterium]